MLGSEVANKTSLHCRPRAAIFLRHVPQAKRRHFVPERCAIEGPWWAKSRQITGLEHAMWGPNIAIQCHTLPYLVNIVHPGRSFSCKEMVDDLSALGLRHVGDTTEATGSHMVCWMNCCYCHIVTVFKMLHRFSLTAVTSGGVRVSCWLQRNPKGKNKPFSRPRTASLVSKKYWLVLVQKIKNDKWKRQDTG